MDNSDGSITLSPDLVKRLGVNTRKIIGKVPIEKCEPTFVFLFWNEKQNCFAFIKADPEFASNAQCSIVAFNPEQETTGFIPHCPNVPYVFYKLKICDKKAQFIVNIEKHKEYGEIYNFYDATN